MVIGIDHSKGKTWFSTLDVSKACKVRDKWDLTQDGQRADLSDVKELLGTSTTEEVLIYCIQQVKTTERNRKQITFLSVLWNYPGEIYALIVGEVPLAAGTIAAVLTGLIVPVPPSAGPPKRTSDLISDDHHFQPATFARSNFHVISNLPLYTLLSRIPPEATP